jgi:hypothetical protein
MRGLTAAAGAPRGTLRAVAGPVTPGRACPCCHFRSCLCTRVRTISRRLCIYGIRGDAIENTLLKFFAKNISGPAHESPRFGPCHAVIDFEAETRLPLALRHTHRTTGIRKRHLTVVGGWRGAALSLPPACIRLPYADNLSQASPFSLVNASTLGFSIRVSTPLANLRRRA